MDSLLLFLFFRGRSIAVVVCLFVCGEGVEAGVSTAVFSFTFTSLSRPPTRALVTTKHPRLKMNDASDSAQRVFCDILEEKGADAVPRRAAR